MILSHNQRFNQKNYIPAVSEPSYSPPSFHHLAEHHRHHRAHRRRRNPRPNDRRGIHAAVLRAVGDNIDRDQLQGRNVQDQESAHLIARHAAGVCP